MKFDDEMSVWSDKSQMCSHVYMGPLRRLLIVEDVDITAAVSQDEYLARGGGTNRNGGCRVGGNISCQRQKSMGGRPVPMITFFNGYFSCAPVKRGRLFGSTPMGVIWKK